MNDAFFLLPLKISSTISKSKMPTVVVVVVVPVVVVVVVCVVFEFIDVVGVFIDAEDAVQHFLSHVCRTNMSSFLAYLPSCEMNSHRSYYLCVGVRSTMREGEN